MGATMDMVLNAISKRKPGAHTWQVNVAFKVHPFAAIPGPCDPAKGFGNTSLDDRVFDRPEMFAGHIQDYAEHSG
jgi:hypothetical protein